MLLSNILLADISLDSAVAQASERYGGRVLSAKTQHGPNGNTHLIRILTPDGHVKRVRVDAESKKSRRPFN